MSDSCKDISSLLKKTGFENLDKKFFEPALTHPSYTIEHKLPATDCYERLEFLGDAVLKLVVSDMLYKKFPKSNEGKLSNIRAILVSDDFLFNLAQDLKLKNYLRLSKAFEKEGGRKVVSVSACAFEAFLGVLFEQGVEMTKISEFLNNLYSKYDDELKILLPKFNSKATLQEHTQKINQDLPTYELVSKVGEDNDATFTVKVSYGGEELGIGVGKSKKQAEREAAYNACLKLKITGENDE